MMGSIPETNSSEGGSAVKEASCMMDIESHAVAEAYLQNTTVRNISWRGVTVTVKDRETKQPKTIVDNVQGYVEAGESYTTLCTTPYHPPLRPYLPR